MTVEERMLREYLEAVGATGFNWKWFGVPLGLLEAMTTSGPWRIESDSRWPNAKIIIYPNSMPVTMAEAARRQVVVKAQNPASMERVRKIFEGLKPA